MSEEWIVHSADVIPNIAETIIANNGQLKDPLIPLNDNEIFFAKDEDIENSNNSILSKDDEVCDDVDGVLERVKYMTSSIIDVTGPQPSELWPSDHFMIVVKASF